MGDRVVRRCWANFQCRGVLLIWNTVGQGPTVLAVGAGGGCVDIFSLVYHFSLLSLSLWETARSRLKYCLKGPLNPKQPTNQPFLLPFSHTIFCCLNRKKKFGRFMMTLSPSNIAYYMLCGRPLLMLLKLVVQPVCTVM